MQGCKLDCRPHGNPADRAESVECRWAAGPGAARAVRAITTAALFAAFALLLAATLPPIDGGGALVASAQADNGNDHGDDGGGNGRGNDDGQDDDGQGHDGQGDDGAGGPSWTGLENDGPDGTGDGGRDDDLDGTAKTDGTGKAGGGGVDARADGTGSSQGGARDTGGHDAPSGPSPEDDAADEAADDGQASAGGTATVHEALRGKELSAEEEAAVIASGWTLTN